MAHSRGFIKWRLISYLGTSLNLQTKVSLTFPNNIAFGGMVNLITTPLCQICILSLDILQGSCKFDITENAFFIFIISVFSCDQAALWMVQSVCPSVRLSVCLSHLFDYVPIIASSWHFQELLPMTEVTSIQKVEVRGQRSRSQRSPSNLAVSGP